MTTTPRNIPRAANSNKSFSCKIKEFEGRAKQLKSWINGSTKDDNGHGTHTAGTVGSKTYGVAKKTKLFGFKVLDRTGNGDDSGVIAAIDEVVSDSKNRGCPKGVAINLSLGTNEGLQAMNDAVAGALKRGIFVSAAAGNSNTDAKNAAPAGEPTICTVGATDDRDNKASFSNYGSVVDIQAPGVNVQSTMPGGGTVSSILLLYVVGHQKGNDVNLHISSGQHVRHVDGFSSHRWSWCLPHGPRGSQGLGRL